MVRIFSIVVLIFWGLTPGEGSLLAQQALSVHPLGEWRPVNSPYGPRNRPGESRLRQFHKGIDIEADEGDPVYAWRSGRVVFTGRNSSAGNIIRISHADGYFSEYFHLKKIGVKADQFVKAGQQIGQAGRTGRVTGAHLHFGIIKDHRHRDPFSYVQTSISREEQLNLAKSPLVPGTTIAIEKAISFRSRPDGARVSVDGEEKGHTPLVLILPYGDYFLEIDAGEGYVSHLREISIGEHTDFLYDAALESAPADTARLAELGRGGEAMGYVSDREMAYDRQSYLSGMGGILVSGNFLESTFASFRELSNAPAFNFDLRFNGFLFESARLGGEHLFTLGFTFLNGTFLENITRDPLGPGLNSQSATRLDRYSQFAGVAGYRVNPRIWGPFSASLGADYLYGITTLNGYRLENPTGDPNGPRLDGPPVDFRYDFRGFSASAGLWVYLSERWVLTGNYMRTLNTEPLGWSGWKIGLLNRFTPR